MNSLSMDQNERISQISGTTYYDKTGVAYYQQDPNQNINNINNINNLNNLNSQNMNMSIRGNVNNRNIHPYNDNIIYTTSGDNDNNFQYSEIAGEYDNQSMIINNEGYYNSDGMIQPIVDDNNINNSNHGNNEYISSTQYYTQSALVPYNDYAPLIPTQNAQNAQNAQNSPQKPQNVQKPQNGSQNPVTPEGTKGKTLDLDGKAKPFSPSSTSTSIVTSLNSTSTSIISLLNSTSTSSVSEGGSRADVSVNNESKKVEMTITKSENVMNSEGEKEGVEEEKNIENLLIGDSQLEQIE